MVPVQTRPRKPGNNRRSPVPSIQVNERGCPDGRKRAPWAAAVTTREPKQRVWRAVAAEEGQAGVGAAPRVSGDTHFAVKQDGRTARASRPPQILPDVGVQV